jgi:hypothetical protein
LVIISIVGLAGPLGVLAVDLAATTTDVEDVDDEPLGGCCQDFRQRLPPLLKTLMACPLGVLTVGPAAASPMLKMAMVGLWGLLSGFSTTTTTGVEDVDGGLPRGVLAVGPTVAIIDVEDVDGRPPVGAVGIFGSDHHRS